MRWFLVIGFALTVPLMGFGDGPFVKLSYSKALKQAEEEGKLVFVDFYTTWCGPCKMLDKYTWPNEVVQGWLTEHTVPLKIDADRQRGLARKYGVRSYPSLVFIDPSGRRLHTINGFRKPRDFMAEVEWFARDPFKRLKLGKELEKQGQFDRALCAYLWCIDYGVAVNAAFARERQALLVSLQEMAKTKRSVRKALKARGLGETLP